jgi:hypothetical protein
MTYSKPEVVFLGTAATIVEFTGAKLYPNLVDWVWGHNPGYDLDE